MRPAVPIATLAIALGACSRPHPGGGIEPRPAASASAAHAATWPLRADAAASPPAAPRRGMVWIPPGRLFAGTPTGRTPRVPDEELAGVPVDLNGFYIDEYPFPNEVAAIPRTGMNQGEAAALCAQHGKRLCTELEWERACKGPSNFTYEYGDTHRPAECATGVSGRLSPSGTLPGCKSAFGVHDMHGGPWEWTASAWNRGSVAQSPTKGDGRLATLRGGNGDSGELVGRCANGIGRVAGGHRPDFGTRCCAGEPNSAEVVLPVTQAKTLAAIVPSADGFAAFEQALKGRLPPEFPSDKRFKVDRAWLWHPMGNEELEVAAGCAPLGSHLVCGVGVFRADGDAHVLDAFAPSGWWMPVVKVDVSSTRDLWIFGGDDRSSFKRRIAYLWGRVAIGAPERSVRAPPP